MVTRHNSTFDLINDPKSLSIFALIISAIIAGPGSWLFNNYYNSRAEFERATKERLLKLEKRKSDNLQTFVTHDDHNQVITELRNRINTLEKRQYDQLSR